MAGRRGVRRWEHRVQLCLGECETRKAVFDMGMAGFELVTVTREYDEWWLYYKRPWYPRHQWAAWECRYMNSIDFRYWFCECEYVPPYGKVISADCEKHD